MCEKIVFKKVFNFFRENFLITAFQSGFLPRDGTVNQLVQLYHIFCEALDRKKEVRVVFCDISKAFDRVWHKGLIFKLHQMGIRGKLLDWFRDYLSDRIQRVTLNGVHSNWGNIEAGVPQGSVLGPLLFLVYINDISKVVTSNIRLFADDTTLFITVDDDPVRPASQLNHDLREINKWANQWLVKFSPPKTESMVISNKQNTFHPPLFFGSDMIKQVNEHKHLGLWFSSDLSWHKHIDEICMKADKRVDILSRLKYILDRKTLETMYTSFIRPILEYSDVIWDNASEYQLKRVEDIQYRAGKIVSGAISLTPKSKVYKELAWESLSTRREKHKLLLFHRIVNNHVPKYLSDLVGNPVSKKSKYNLRNQNDITIAKSNTEKFRKSFIPSATRLWNNKNNIIRNINNTEKAKSTLMKSKSKSNAYFSLGNNRRISIVMARLRMECSLLKSHLFDMKIINDSKCVCGHSREDTSHFFFSCPLYNISRNVLQNSIQNVANWDCVDTLLYGTGSTINDSVIFSSVCKFICNSGRFSL